MYKPSRDYEASITDHQHENHFTIWFRFNEQPELLVSKLLQTMGFTEKVSSNSWGYQHVNDTFKLGFATEFVAALKKGEFPTTIPYIASHSASVQSIRGDRYSLAYIFPERTNRSFNETLLIFETLKEKREGYAWVLKWLKYQERHEDAGLEVNKKASRTVALLLLNKKDGFKVNLPNPFGTFGEKIDLEGLDAQSNLDHIYDEKSLPSELDETSSSQLARHVELDEDSSTEIARHDQLVTESMSVETNNESLTTILEEENTEKENFPQLARHVKLATDSSTQIARHDELEEESLTGTDNNEEDEQELESDDFPFEEIQEQEITTAEDENDLEEYNQKCYQQINELLPDLQNQLERGVLNSASYAGDNSEYEQVGFRFLDKRSSSIYLLQLEFIKEQEEASAFSLRIKFIIDFDNRAIAIEDWTNDEEREFNPDKITRYIKVLYELAQTAMDDGHEFDLSSETVQSQNPAQESKGSVKRIIIKEPLLGSKKVELREFYSWETANDFINTIEQGYARTLTIGYRVVWNDHTLDGEVELFSPEFQPQLNLNIIGHAALGKMLQLKYIKEKRYLGRNPFEIDQSLLNQVKVDQLLAVLDFGIDKESSIEKFQPKIPIVSIEVEGALISLHELTNKYEGIFAAANGKLDSLKMANDSNYKATIKARWKNGTAIARSIAYDKLEEQSGQTTWRKWLEVLVGERNSFTYQTDDVQPLLFDYEMDFPLPEKYFKSLVEAYWRPIDVEKELKFHLNAHSYHSGRLARVLVKYLDEIDWDNPKWNVTKKETSNAFRLFYLNYGKLENEAKKTLALIGLIDSSRSPNTEARKILVTMLLNFMRASETLVDLPLVQEQKPERKQTVKERTTGRIELNRSIEALIDQKGFESVDYSAEEINLLKQYTGYGGSKLSETHKGLLYEYYTPDEVVKMMWVLAHEFGYKGGAVCEPSCGIGSFIKYAPRNARIEGYETRLYSARICQLLYPNATIKNKPFEQLFYNGNIYLNGQFRTEPFDLIIGNPPYGEFTGKYAGLGEKKRTKAVNYEHYFISRGLDLLNPEGLLIYIIPNSFLKNGQKYDALKAQIALKCTLEFSWRLSKDIFKHTSIETDILVLRRR